MKLLKAEAGVNDGKAGLLSAAGLFAKGGIFDKKSESFNIQELDPYLLFDARSSMLGTLENPTLDLDPATPSTLDVITATRSSVATRTLPDGRIALAEQDTVRVDYTQGAELTPTKFQNIGYTDFSSGWAGQSGVTSEAGDEYENQPVRRVIYDGVTTGGIYQTVINTVGDVSYTGSFYIRRISGSTPLYMRHGFAASGNQTAISVTTEWQQFSVTMLGASGGGNVYFGIIQFGAGNDVYEITQPQLEEGTTASDFVANTTGSPKFLSSAVYSDRVPMILVEPSAINGPKTSENFNSSEWTQLGNGQGSAPIVTDNYAYSPDGTQNATRLQVSLNGGNAFADQSLIYDIDNSNTVQTISVWMKSNTNDAYDIYLANTHIGNGTDIAQVTPQWQRFSFSHTTSNHTFSLGLRGGIGASDSADILIWGAQGEAGSVATSYIPTAGSTVTRAADDLQIERDSTNLVTDSNSFGVYGTTVETTGFEAPDGSNNSTKISNIQDGAGERAHCLVTSVSGSTSYAGAIYIKGTAGQTIRVQAKRYTGDFSGSSTQAITLDGTWQRVTSLAWTSASNNTNAFIVIKNEFGTTADEVYLWGAQIEEGSESTSLIPTSGAAASRTTFSDFYNQSEGTFYAESVPRSLINERYLTVSDGTSHNRVVLYQASSLSRFLVAKDDATQTYSANTASSINTLNRIAGSYKLNNFLTSANGTQFELTDTSGTPPTSVNRMNVGSNETGVLQLNGHIKRLLFWPTHSSRL